MVNERITENIVRKHFENDTFFEREDIEIEEQISKLPRIKKLLSNASKNGSGAGYPEFIISFRKNPDFIIVVECKADLKKHESKKRDNPKDYAVDGALLYSSYLSKEYDVLSIAVSGENKKELKVSHFLQLQGKNNSHKIFDNELLSFKNYINGYKQDDRKFKQSYEDLLKYSKTLNDMLHSKKVKESDRSLLISGILMALKDKSFRKGYEEQSNPKSLAENLVTTIKQQLNSETLGEKSESLVHQYGFIKIHPTLSKNSDKYKEVLRDLIKNIDENINSFMKTYKYYDVLGQFYIEFLKYANNDKGLGIVLTPPHITELFSDLTFVDKNSVVLDNCTGTSGFLISAMQKMIKDSKGDEERIKKIKKNQLIGIEEQPNIFALACSNMYIHGDGKSNIYYGDCFNEDTIKKIREKHNPNVGFLNPPYKNNKDDIEEFNFIINNLSMLEKGSYCVAIIPMSCVLAQKGARLELKKKLLENHTLEAVFSMPDELFTNSKVSVVTCVVVLKAHQKHPKDYETYFGYWKKDGFVKKKTTGRADYFHKWDDIKNKWLNAYRNKKEIKGHSVRRNVSYEDEWCAEAYMETDYNDISIPDFERSVLDYSGYLFINKLIGNASNTPSKEADITIDTSTWKTFNLYNEKNPKKGLFKIYSSKDGVLQDYALGGDTPLVSSTAQNNGIIGYVESEPTNKGNTITVNRGGSVGEAFYQSIPYIATPVDVRILELNYKLNKYTGLFLTTLIKKEKYRFNFSRKMGTGRLRKLKIKLPVNDEGSPDWDFMEKFIKSLPYSSNI